MGTVCGRNKKMNMAKRNRKKKLCVKDRLSYLAHKCNNAPYYLYSGTFVDC